MMVGVYAERWVEPVAGALESLGVRRGVVVHGKVGEGMDELTTAGPTCVRGVGELRSINATWLPGDHGFETCDPKVLVGGTAEQNFATFGDLLMGGADEGLTDTVYLSAGTALWVAGVCATVEAGATRARELAAEGAVRETLRKIRDLYRN
jgi:anthranilate phosphoribosyltransferase